MSVAETRGRRRPAVPGMADLIGADLELRLAGGAVVRGELVALDSTYMVVERVTTGRRTYLRRDAVQVIVDERPPLLATASRKSAEDALGGGDARG